jgi:hypothetical protein
MLIVDMNRARKWIWITGSVVAMFLAGCKAAPRCCHGSIPVPISAKSIKSSETGFGLAYDFQLMFKAPYADSERAAEKILAMHRSQSQIPQPDYVRVHIENGKYLRTKWEDSFVLKSWARAEGCKPWFQPDRIINGIFVGAIGGHVPQVWIDKDRNVLYFRETD